MAALFTAGIVYMMMTLAGYFEPKVKPIAPATPVGPAVEGQSVVEVKLVKRPRTESAVGTIRAIHEVVVASKILARVKEVKIKAGQTVKAGDELVVLDDADLQARLQQAQAAESGANAKLNQARIDVERAKRLRAVNSVSQQEVEQANTAYLVRQGRARTGPASGQGGPDLPGLCLDPRADRWRDRGQEGESRRHRQPGPDAPDHVRSRRGCRWWPRCVSRWRWGWRSASRWPRGSTALDLDCHATISEIVPEAQAESRSFQVKVIGPCPPNVYSGMFGRIFIPLGEEEVLVVPPQAVRRVGQLDEVDVVQDGTPCRHVVQLGRTLPEGREVLSGLQAGERVVVPRPSSSREGRS